MGGHGVIVDVPSEGSSCDRSLSLGQCVFYFLANRVISSSVHSALSSSLQLQFALGACKPKATSFLCTVSLYKACHYSNENLIRIRIGRTQGWNSRSQSILCQE